MKQFYTLVLLFFTLIIAKGADFDYVFQKGMAGYECFRIPAIVKAKNGDLVAFAEARKSSCSDTGDIDLVMRRSSDGGKSWSALSVLWDDGNNVCGNPAPVVERKSGTIFLLLTWNLGSDHERDIIALKSEDTRRVYVTKSTDHGLSWERPKEITSTTKLENWTWYATGPVHGIQLQHNKKLKGRLVIPCDHIEAETKTIAISIYDRVQAFDNEAAGTMSAFLLVFALLITDMRPEAPYLQHTGHLITASLLVS